MSIKLGDAIVFFRGDKRPLEQDQADAKRSTRSWANKVGGLIKTGLAAGAAAAGAAVVGTLAAAGAAVKKAMPLEGIAESFYSMADGAKLAELRVGSLNTVTDADLMKSYNSAALLVSESFAEDLPNAMQYFGKISAATGEDVGFLMDSYVTGIGRLSPMILDNLKIQVDANQAYEDYADKIGVATKELTKEQQQLALSEQVMGLLAEKTAAMPDITDNAATKAAQLTAAWGNFTDQAGMALMPIATRLLGFLADLAQKYGPIAAKFLERFAEIIEDFTWMLEAGVDPLTAIKIALTQAFGPEVGALFETIVGKIRTVVEWIQARLPAAVGFLQGIWNEAWPIVQQVVADVVAFVGPLLQEMIAFSIEQWTKIYTWIQENLPLIQSTITRILNTIQTIWNTVWPEIQTVVMVVWGIIKTIIGTQITAVLGIIKAVMQAINGDWAGAWETIKGVANTIWNGIKSVIMTLLTGIWTGITRILGMLGIDWETTWTTIETVAQNVWTVIKAVWEELGRWINDNLVPWVDELKRVWAEDVWPAIQSALEAAWDAIEPVFSSIKEWLGETLPPIVEGIKETFNEAMSNISSAIDPVKEAIDGIKRAATEFWNWITSHEFNFKIKIPNLPDWATPGSPLPIHTAWKAFGDEMNRMNIRPRVDLGAVSALQQGMSRQVIDRSDNRSYQFDLHGNYREQDEVSMADDVRFLAMQFGAA